MSTPADAGFADISGARAIVRRIKLRIRLRAIQASATALLDILNQGFEADRLAVEARVDQAINSLSRSDDRVIDHVGKMRVECEHEREKELLEGVELLLDLLGIIRAGFGQGLFSSRSKAQTTPPADAGHRLSGAAK